MSLLITSFLILKWTLLKLSGLICNGFVRFVNVTLFFNGCTLLIELTGNGFLALVCLCPLCRNPIIENALIVHCKRLFYTFETEKFWTKEFIFCRLSSFNHNMGVREGVDDTPMIDWWVPQRPSCLKSVSWFFFYNK